MKRLIVKILTIQATLTLKRNRPFIIAITGNVGKTTTKDAIYTALKGTVRTRKSEKSFNSDIGVPLTILGLPNAWSNPLRWIKVLFDGMLVALFQRDYPKVLVLEMGVDRPGDMKKLTSWIRPNVVVLTRLPDVPVHVEYFDSPEAVIQEKLVLVEALADDGVFVYNQDDEKVRQVAEDTRQRSVGYSRYSESDFTASQDEIIYDDAGLPTGLTFTLTHDNVSAKTTLSGAVGVQHTYNYAAAAAVASLFDISLTDAAAALSGQVPPPGRMRIIPALKDTTIIDDTYNSSPVAAERALSTLHEIKCTGRKIAVLGDMLELGQYSVEAHGKVGVQAAETCDVLVTVGVRSRRTAEVALEHGMDEADVFQYDDAARAGRELQNFIAAGDVLLVKGSQSIRCERIVKELMAHPEDAEELLVRQSQVWQDKR